ncbi:MAG: DUF3343 domain-containing protein [Bacillota bacterium]|nr:DUF3343 domain-containing protein [Bacillota bacterium]MDW7684635.1 DUF3343 domain-containing protein [Bacillota bacterium]
MENYYVATFYSVSQALRFEKLLQSEGLEVKMIPVPRVISSSCGIAARFSDMVLTDVADLLVSERAQVEDVYRFESDGKRIHAERVLLHSDDKL